MAKANLAAIILITLLLAPFLAIPRESKAQVTSSSNNWEMFLHDSAHTGSTTSAGPTKPIELWNFSEGNFGAGAGSCAAVVNGVVYVGSNELAYEAGGGQIYAFDAYTGAKIWNYPTKSAVHSSPAVSEGMVFIGADNDILALNALTGAKIWSYPTEGYVFSSPAVVGGVIYIGSFEGSLYET